MTERERLLELLKKAPLCNRDFDLQYSDGTIEKIADYLLANGVIVPPCKVGDTVYYFSHRPFNLSVKANTVYEAEVVRIVTTRLGTSLIIQIRNEYGCTEVPDIRSWGISVFATEEEEEAEQALRKEDEGK